MRRDSLAFRLIASSAAWSTVILAVSGFLLSSMFRSAVERTFDERLLVTLDGLLTNVEFDEAGSLIESTNLGDSRYVFPLQGWYWQVASLEPGSKNELKSDSLLEKRLEFDRELMGQRDENGLVRFYQTGPDGIHLRVIEQRFQLDGSDELISFMVTGNSDDLEVEIAKFNQTLLITLSVLAIGLAIAAFIQVRIGLEPLRRLRSGLIDIRKGTAERLTGTYPSEIEPVAREVNALLKANVDVIERARTQVGNLAHALKTPLSVIGNEARSGASGVTQKISEQAEIMADQINLYLDRARRAARSEALGSLCDVKPVVDGLVRTLNRIYAERGVSPKVDCPPDVRFLGERQDLEEMIGNLLDNAFKWAAGQVGVQVFLQSGGPDNAENKLTLIVSDDGPGLPEDRRSEALVRGKRLDETKPGSGLGLSIVAETAAMYGGSVSLQASSSGGLRVELILPGSSSNQ